MAPVYFPFNFVPAYLRLSRLFGVTPQTSNVRVSGSEMTAMFGPWRIHTALSNIEHVEVTGPYHFIKTAGPARLSFADHGLTFATNGVRGVYVTFRRPIRGGEPTGRLRHPNLTLTVADCDALVDALQVKDQVNR